MSRKKLRAVACAINQQLNVGVARRPRIAEQFAAERLEVARGFVAEEVERGAQGRAPFLIPTLACARMTTAIARPTPDAVRATPSRAFAFGPGFDLNFKLRLMRGEKRAVVHHLEAARVRFDFERVSERAVAEDEMMPVTLA